jgi:Protein of unknown function (DUF3119)
MNIDIPLSFETRLNPSYKLPLAIVMLALPCVWLNTWLALAIAIFGIFLAIQAKFLTLVFSSSNLDIYRGETLIRQFPYSDWQNWQIFWQKVPVLFYFKEVKSIHFLPIIFDPLMLQTCLEKHCPKAESF